MKFYKVVFSLIIVLSTLTMENFAQTKSYGNYEVYSYETSKSAFSYLTMKLNLPYTMGTKEYTQTGFLYSHQYYLSEIGAYVFSGDAKLRFITEGNFNIGFAMGKKDGELTTKDVFSLNSRFYLVKIDFFAYDVATEFTYVLNDGYALTAKLGLNLISIGATVGLPDKGMIKRDAFGTVNIMPLTFKPQILFDFGRSLVGIGMLIHPKNIIEFRYLPKDVFGNDNTGFQFNSDTFNEFAIQLWYVF